MIYRRFPGLAALFLGIAKPLESEVLPDVM